MITQKYAMKNNSKFKARNYMQDFKKKACKYPYLQVRTKHHQFSVWDGKEPFS